MNSQPHDTGSVLVIVDPAFGEKLRRVTTEQPIWIVMSPANEAIVRSLWAGEAAPSNPSEITGFRLDDDVSAEDLFLAELETIDLHHGPYSSSSPYTQIEVRGARLTAGVRAGLSEFGFTDFAQTKDGFTARRSQDEALQLRE